MEKVAKKIPLEDAEDLDIEYWKFRTPEEKLDTLQYLYRKFGTCTDFFKIGNVSLTFPVHVPDFHAYNTKPC